MTKYAEAESRTLNEIDRFNYPSVVTKCLKSLLHSLDGIIDSEYIPKICHVKTIDGFIDHLTNQLRAAMAAYKVHVTILPDGSPETCGLIMFINDARKLLMDIIDDMCQVNRCIYVATGFPSLRLESHAADDYIANSGCVIYIFEDRVNSLPKDMDCYFSICNIHKAIETMCMLTICANAEFLKNDQEAIFDELIDSISINDCWISKIRARDLRKILSDKALAKNFIDAHELLMSYAHTIFISRGSVPIAEATDVLAKTYRDGGASVSKWVVSAIMEKYYMSSKVDVLSYIETNYAPFTTKPVLTFIINVDDTNFIDNVLRLAKLLSSIIYNDLGLENETILGLNEFSARVHELSNA